MRCDELFKGILFASTLLIIGHRSVNELAILTRPSRGTYAFHTFVIVLCLFVNDEGC